MSMGSPLDCIDPKLVNAVLQQQLRYTATATQMRTWIVNCTNLQALLVVPANPYRVSCAIVVPSGNDAFMGSTKYIQNATAAQGQYQTGFQLLAGETWVFGPEYSGDIWIIMASAVQTITGLELSYVPPAGL